MIDVRSDTVTLPTEEMRQAMASAQMGDDVYGDDPTVNRLQELAAGLVGKEAALFVPTGTMGNQLAIMSHTKRGDDVLCLRDSHIYKDECGAPAILSGVTLNVVDSEDGILHGRHIIGQIRPDDIHCPPTTLVCTENALATGQAVPLESCRELYETSRKHGLKVHMDGARLFNAATALGVLPAEIAQYTDSVMFCLSKGLCAPIGSMLCGTRAFVARSLRGRKILGGGMRQVGCLAAAGIIALEKMTGRLQEDHNNAQLLAKRLGENPLIQVIQKGVQINMVFFKIDCSKETILTIPGKMLEKDILMNPASDGKFRIVTHHGITAADVDHIADSLTSIVPG